MIPSDPEALDSLAAEYVLGTLDARQAIEVVQALPFNQMLRGLVTDWEVRLAPLSSLAPPVTPPAEVWQRVEASLAVRPEAPVRRLRSGWFLRAWAAGASAVAAGLAALILLRPAEPPRLMTVLLTSRDQPAWLVEAGDDGLRLASLNPRPVGPGQAQQLWALPPGASAPISLGLLPESGREARVARSAVRPEPGMLIEISLEPSGGSPTGRPTGPVIFIGRLLPAQGT